MTAHWRHPIRAEEMTAALQGPTPSGVARLAAFLGLDPDTEPTQIELFLWCIPPAPRRQGRCR